MKCVILKGREQMIVLIPIAASKPSAISYLILTKILIKDVAPNLRGNKILYQMTVPCAQNVVASQNESKFLFLTIVASVLDVSQMEIIRRLKQYLKQATLPPLLSL